MCSKNQQRQRAIGEAGMLVDAVRVLRWWSRAEHVRQSQGPEVAINGLRLAGLARRRRSAAGRRRLRRVIHWLDRISLQPNCLRRVLLEVALDPTAAAQPVYLGLRHQPERPRHAPRIGHAWLADDSSVTATDYDAVVRLDPPPPATPSENA